MIGTKVADRYEIVAKLGQGGMGVVYRARDPVLNRDVAVKVVPPAYLTPDAEERFEREAQLVAQMDHPAIIAVHDFGRHEGSLFYVMPVVRGTHLRSLLTERSLRLGDILEIGIQTAEALDYSHARGVVHRDVKPENIMVSREEGTDLRVRVMDFGLARAATDDRLTKTGMLIGTVTYLSPEQVECQEIDARSDVYSLGTVLYECLVGEPPFSGTLKSVLYRIAHEEPRSPRSLGADVDEALEGIVLQCLAKDPQKRPARAGDVAEALRRYRSRLDEAGRARSIETLLPSGSIEPSTASAFIGREREFAELQRRLNAATGGECQFVVVGGEAGIGKSRLLEELENLAKARGIRVLRGRFAEEDRAFPYQGICDLIRDYFRSRGAGSVASSPPDLSDLAADLTSFFPVLTEISELRTPSSSGGAGRSASAAEAHAADDRTYVFELLARTLTRLAGGRPSVLIVENLHAATVSVEALQYIVHRLGATPTLVGASYRPAEIEKRHPVAVMLAGFAGDPRFASILLSPFTPAEHQALVESLLGTPPLATGLAEQLYAATEGNPFFTKELVRSLLDSGRITRNESGAWSLSAEISSDALPATIQQAVERRIERLPEDLREVLSIASVLGRTFELRDLEALAEGHGDVEGSVDRLAREGILEEERGSRGDRLAFSSGVVRDVLYAAYPRRRRKSLHRRYAERLEARHATRLERAYPQLVYHYSQADVPDKAVEYGLKSAVKSLAAFSPDAAIRAARTALEFLEDEGWEGDRSLAGEARVLLASALRMAGHIDGALKEAEAAVRVFEREKQARRAAAAVLLAAETAWQGRRVEETRAWLERGIEVARGLGEGETECLTKLLTLAGTVSTLRGEYERAGEYLEEVERLSPSAREKDRARAEEVAPPGGTLIVALANPVRASAPVEIATAEEVEVFPNVFETLVTTNATGHLVPCLCEKWEDHDQGTRFLLPLRREARFSDGEPLTAQDVKASIERAARTAPSELPAAYAAIQGVEEYVDGRADGIAGIRVLAAGLVEVRLTEPLPVFPALLTDPRTGVAREAGPGLQGVRVVGTGPFRLAAQEPDRIVLERSPAYWRGTPPLLDAVEFRTASSASAIAEGVRSGEFDLARDLLPEDLEQILRDHRRRETMAEAPRSNTYFVLFNCRRPIVESATVRTALGGVVRTQELVWRSLGGFAQPADGLIPPGILGHDPGRRRALLGRERSLERLRSAGCPPPIRLKAAVHPILQDRYRSLTEALLRVWSDLGVEVSIETRSMEAFLAASHENEAIDVWLGRWGADYPDPDNFSYGLFHSRSGRFRKYFSSPETDRMIEEARAQAGSVAREALYRRFDGRLVDSAIVIPLFHDVDYRLASPKVRGLRLRTTPPYVNYAEIGKVEAPARPASRAGGGGVIRVPTPSDIRSLDPTLVALREHADVIPNVFETLTRVVKGARAFPWLASEFQAEAGTRRFRIRLRPGIHFHDGRRLTARDVRYSYERLLQGGRSQGQRLLSPIRGARALMSGEVGDLEGFRILSSSEFTIELERPMSFFPELLSDAPAAIVPEGSDSFEGSWRDRCVGTGPFRVVRFSPGEQLELERNPSYWREGYPRSDGLVFSLGVPPDQILAGFRAGRFSIAFDLFPADVEALRNDPTFAPGYRETPRLSTYWAVFNPHRGPLADEGLRRRLLECVDVDDLVQRTLGRLAIPAQGLIPPGLLGHERRPARRLASGTLGEKPSGPAGMRSSYPKIDPSAPTMGLFHQEIELTAAISPVLGGEGHYSALARGLLAAFERAGVRVRVVSETAPELFAALRDCAVDMIVGRWGADYPDADSFAHGMLHTEEGFAGRYCGSAEIDRLVERGRAESDPAVRHSIYREVEALLSERALLLPLFHEQIYRFARPELEGLGQINFLEPVVAYENLRIRR